MGWFINKVLQFNIYSCIFEHRKFCPFTAKYALNTFPFASNRLICVGIFSLDSPEDSLRLATFVISSGGVVLFHVALRQTIQTILKACSPPRLWWLCNKNRGRKWHKNVLLDKMQNRNGVASDFFSGCRISLLSLAKDLKPFPPTRVTRFVLVVFTTTTGCINKWTRPQCKTDFKQPVSLRGQAKPHDTDSKHESPRHLYFFSFFFTDSW